ncbi:hypothetical protein B5F07_04595 [Lachnoclostridium sp. An169]|uniref:hypothetical protein n=1 Tax=Lachnoclostridium sp. An169 TaxID=1965569 RepID=UPI000B372C9A|nr:hypothetical protein [Lachnoclostridium sp. An169]OUP85428.1 hypothetical protein B5F07_04595 [Lachnoclostridium sp. An169]HJA67897.1 hypothetical protein [Candidatus Mediterraneibacter cottocaccae]
MNSKYAYIFRIVLAAYLAFLGGRLLYVMIEQRPANMGAMSFIAVVYMILGVAYAIYSGRKLWKILKNEKAVRDLDKTQELPVIDDMAVHAASQAQNTAAQQPAAPERGVAPAAVTDLGADTPDTGEQTGTSGARENAEQTGTSGTRENAEETGASGARDNKEQSGQTAQAESTDEKSAEDN